MAREMQFVPSMRRVTKYVGELVCVVGVVVLVASDTWERGAWTANDFVKFDGDGPSRPDFSATGAAN